ncbi:unnamed protein product [Heterobilharzia americana]|nr:unnamed protein product [Heterobilharzia americana]
MTHSTQPVKSINLWYIFECERLKQLHLPLTRLQLQHFHKYDQIESNQEVKANECVHFSKYNLNTCPIHNNGRRNLLQPFTTLNKPINCKCTCINHGNIWGKGNNKLEPVNLPLWCKPELSISVGSLRKKAQEDYQQYRLYKSDRKRRDIFTGEK